MSRRIARLFVRSAGCLLILTGSAKIISSTGSAPVLGLPDPVFQIPFRYEFVIVGLLELAVAAVCMLDRSLLLRQILLLTWISSAFLFYRLCVEFIGYTEPCRCLGTLTDSLHLLPQTGKRLLTGMLAYILCGSYWMLFCIRRWENHHLTTSESCSQKAF